MNLAPTRRTCRCNQPHVSDRRVAEGVNKDVHVAFLVVIHRPRNRRVDADADDILVRLGFCEFRAGWRDRTVIGLAMSGPPKAIRIINFIAADRVALGRCRPRAPTDPYVPTLEHTVPLIMVSLRAGDSNGRYAREQAGIDQG